MLREGIDRNMDQAIRASMRDPTSAMVAKTHPFWRNGARPSMIRITSTSSSTAWPATMRGPATGPLRALSLMVAVITGPGMAAPEKAMTNEVPNMARSADIRPPRTGAACGSS
jgi:hypothetical protein